MSGPRLVYIVSNVEKSLALEWTASRLAMRYDLTFLLLNPGGSSMETYLRVQGINCVRFTLRSKFSYPVLFVRIFLFLVSMRPHCVHVHLLEAQRLGLTAAWMAGIKKRIYTRHTSTFHHSYKPSGVKYDRVSNRLSTRIVSISQATDYVLTELEHTDRGKIARIPHGFDWNAFEVSPDRIEKVRKKWSIPTRRPVIGMVSRFIDWKGVEFGIDAFVSFREKYPDACLVLANANGPQEAVIRKRLKQIDSAHMVTIPFEEDVIALYNVFDLFVHVPVDQYVEAFGQAYVEAMASRVPSVVTLSGVAAEYVEDRRHAMVVPFKNSAAIDGALTELWQSQELRDTIVKNAREEVVSRFGIDRMITLLNQLYDA